MHTSDTLNTLVVFDSLFYLNSAYKQSKTAMTACRTRPPSPQNGAWLIVLALGPHSSLMWLGCSGRNRPQGVVTARPSGRAGGNAGTPLAPLPLSGTS